MAANSKIEWTDLKGRRLGAAKSAAKKTGVFLETWLLNREMGKNWCFRCRAWKNQSEFAMDRSRLSGYASQCKPCVSIASKATLYKISAEKVRSLSHQPCGICGREGASMAIDHCHKTGRVRDGLCQRCNVALGLFRDDSELIIKALKYLEVHNGRGN